MNRFDLQQQTDKCYDGFPTDDWPVIGITANYGEQTAKLAEGYYKQVVDAGGTPLLIPPLADSATLMATLDRIDGLLLTGGADLNPLFWGEQPLPQLGGINDERDLPELLITKLAYNRQMPILGICRGIQTLAVALGGKVAQHLSETAVGRIKHSQDAGRHVPTHTVSLQNGVLGSLYEESLEQPTVLPVNSFHHQAVTDAGPRLRVSATAPDGVIEAVESAEHKPVLGVQWHPECMGKDGQPLFSSQEVVSTCTYLRNRSLTLLIFASSFTDICFSPDFPAIVE